LDEQTVRLLCENGVDAARMFLLYSQQSFQEMLSPIPTRNLYNVSRSNNGVRDLKIYGDYILESNIVDMDSDTMDFSGAEIASHQLYLHSRQHTTRKALKEAAEHEMDA
jgi:hypothetical protein